MEEKESDAASVIPPTTALSPTELLGDVTEVRRKLGAGAFGVVWYVILFGPATFCRISHPNKKEKH